MMPPLTMHAPRLFASVFDVEFEHPPPSHDQPAPAFGDRDAYLGP